MEDEQYIQPDGLTGQQVGHIISWRGGGPRGKCSSESFFYMVPSEGSGALSVQEHRTGVYYFHYPPPPGTGFKWDSRALCGQVEGVIGDRWSEG